MTQSMKYKLQTLKKMICGYFNKNIPINHSINVIEKKGNNTRHWNVTDEFKSNPKKHHKNSLFVVNVCI
uniref:Uncharacterized protein n=1 Tax=Arion vulgaris TaxID=1028688 RepID=A0A0B7B518_9EUPU